MSKRALLLSYAFPPVALPESYLAAKRMANLPDCEVDVITAPPYKKWMGFYDGLTEYIEKRFGEITRIKPTFLAKNLTFWRLGILSQCPDSARLLNGKIREAAERAISTKSYDFIVTWSQWHSVHLVGLALKRQFPTLPWIAYFSDPWTNNPYKNTGALVDKINQHLEHKVMINADVRFFSTIQTLELATQRYSNCVRENSFVLPHGYDPELYSAQEKNPEEKSQLTCRYLGSFYGHRSPDILIKALKKIFDTRPDTLKNTRFEFIGPIEKNILNSVDASGLPSNLISFQQSVGYLESLHLMKTADLLIVIDAPAKENLFLPSKLVDYIGAGRPILGITPPGTPQKIINKLGGFTANPSNLEDVITATQKALSEIIKYKNNKIPWGLQEEREKFSSRSIGKSMMKHIEKFCP
jgi:glycosyltransferase involved in cell wall biosynthesis